MIDKNKKYKTRSGLDVRIYATDGGGEYSVHGAYLDGGEWEQESWTESGHHLSGVDCGSLDLVEVVPLLERWIVVQESNGYITHCCTCTTEQEASSFVRASGKGNRVVHLREVRE
jgi:hypothetical protein